MSYFFRRSASFGPFRLNFSKSGVGASFGVKGARITMTPRGTTYITAGSHGFYYRETLQHAGRAPGAATPPPISPAASTPSDTIETADVSELVDSSSETLIKRLNQRAQMANPAWLLYVVALALGAWALAMSAPGRPLPDVTTLALNTDRRVNSTDEYSLLLARYGQPDKVYVTRPLGVVTVRAIHYVAVNLKVVLVPNGCVATYENAISALRANADKKASSKARVVGLAPCSVAANAGWTIVGYLDTPEDLPVSAVLAKDRLDGITTRQTSPPKVEAEAVSAPKQKSGSRTSPQKEPQPADTLPSPAEEWATAEQVRRDLDAADRSALFWRLGLLFPAIGLFGTGIAVHKKNTEKRTTRLFYELDDGQQQRFNIVQEAVGHLSQCHRLWRIHAESETSDWKRNAGASSLVRRAPVSAGRSNPPRVEANVPISSLSLGSVHLFFLPDVILYLEHGTFGSIAYDDLCVDPSSTRFIESDGVPADSTVVDRTWRYVNKNGGPDRRFNNNVEIPVVRYGVLVLTSSKGLNIHLNTSNADRSQAFANCWQALQPGRSKSSGERVRSDPPPPKTQVASDVVSQARKMLGVSASASREEITSAYRRLVQMYHPDKVASLAPEFKLIAEQRMKEINGAYELLKG